MKHYDSIVIGTGQAGVPLAGALARDGRKVAVIEKGSLGGTCINVGCTPTKAYIASARRAWAMRTGSELGVELRGSIAVDLKKVKARKDAIISDKHRSLNESLDHPNIDLIRGTARFADAHTIEVNGKSMRGDRIFINVGSRPRIPEGFEDLGVLTNREMLALEDILPHLLIVGGGNVGLEFAQMFRRFGSRVTLLDRNESLLPNEDREVGREILSVLKAEGVEVVLGAKDVKASKQKGEIIAKYAVNGTEKSVSGSHLLLAVGRVPNTDALGLDRAGVQVDDRGYISVDDALKTNVEHIYALGDCNGRGAFTHTSYEDFKIVESHLFGDGSRTLANRVDCHATFLDPPLARVGMNRSQILESGREAMVAQIAMKDVARAVEKGESRGFMRAYIDAETDEFLGATFLGDGADECIHLIVDAMNAEMPFQQIRDAMHIHPTVSELIPTMLENPVPLEKMEDVLG